MMRDRKKEIADFDIRIEQMLTRLSVRNILIETKKYIPESYGSWQIIAGTKEKKLDFSYDGKDSYLMYFNTAVVPKDHSDFQHKRFRIWEGEDPFLFVEEVLIREFPH